MTHLRTPLKAAHGLGSAKEGLGHWRIQRLTAVVLALLGVWFVFFVLAMLPADYATVRMQLAKPWNATLMLGFVVALFWHIQLGLQVIIEDYVHTRWLDVGLQTAVKLACGLATIASALAVVRIALGS